MIDLVNSLVLDYWFRVMKKELWVEVWEQRRRWAALALETKVDSSAESGRYGEELRSDDDNSGSPIGGKSHAEAGLPQSSSVESRKEDRAIGSLEKRRHLEAGSPSRGGGHQKKYYSEYVDDDRRNLANKEKSPYRSIGDRYGEGLRGRSLSVSHDHVRGRTRSRSIVEEEAPSRRRSRSRSILEEEARSKRRRYNDREISVYAEKRKAAHNSDDEGMLRKDEREHSISYSRYSGLDRSREREKSREREVDRVRRGRRI